MICLFQTLSGRFYPYEEIRTDAVLGLDEDVLLTTDEVTDTDCPLCAGGSTYNRMPEDRVSLPKQVQILCIRT